MEENIEIWKDIPEYEGLYQVSNMGQVKSLERTIIYKDGRKKIIPERILKLSKDRGGYLYVILSQNAKEKHFKVHRLVALAFIPNDNPIEKTEINHLDENKYNNNVSNLCWCSRIENINYGSRNKRVSKAILQFSLSGVFIKEFDSGKSASEELNVSQGNITNCCKEKLKSAYGFKWVYKSDYKPTYTQLELNFD